MLTRRSVFVDQHADATACRIEDIEPHACAAIKPNRNRDPPRERIGVGRRQIQSIYLESRCVLQIRQA
jgi:hypothetical protein